MKRIFVLTILMFGFYAATAQQPETKKPEVPVISAEHKAEFFKRQLALTQAQIAVQNAQTQLQSAVDAINKDCGGNYAPQLNQQSGDPVCMVKMAPPKEEKK